MSAGFKSLNGRLVGWLLVTGMRLLLGAWMIINGLNHWVAIFPQPLGSHPRSSALLVVLIESGLFGLVKAVEVVGGVLLVWGRFVPVALVMLLPISVVVFYNDAVLQERWNRLLYMGVDCLYLNLILLGAYLRYYLPMLAYKSEPGTFADFKKLPTIFRDEQ